MHAYTYVCTYVCKIMFCMRVYITMYVCMYVRTYVHIYVCMQYTYVHVYIRMHLCTYAGMHACMIYVTIFGKIDHLCVSIEIHFLPVRESYTHALSRNTKYLTIDGQVCFYRQPFANAVEPRGCISQS